MGWTGPCWQRRWQATALCMLGLGCTAAAVNQSGVSRPASQQPQLAEARSQTASDAPDPPLVAARDDGITDRPTVLPPCRPASHKQLAAAGEAAAGDAIGRIETASAEIPPAPAGRAGSEDEPGLLAPLPPPPTGGEHPPDVGAAADGRVEWPIDFETALTIAAGQNPQVAFANERIYEAFARLRAAEVLWLPTINAGASYNKHEGTLQNAQGDMIETSRQSAFGGLGARAVGAGSPATPGLVATFQTTDAVFQPRIARHAAAARQCGATAALNNTLLDVSLAYLNLLAAYQRQTIADETLANARELARLTGDYAETGQGNRADADRARAELSFRENEAARAAEAVGVASARLAQLLSQSPLNQLVPREPSVTPVELVDASAPLNDLLAAGLSNRPELSESSFLVAQAVERLQREQHAVWLPSVLLGMSYGGNGGGIGSEMAAFNDRWDFDAAMWWQVRNLGFGEKAAREEARSQVEQARWRQVQVMDQIAAEIAQAQAQVQARTAQIETARAGIEAAVDSYDRNRERIREGEGLPLEVLQSLQALDQARREYLRAVTDYNESQFRLYRALGGPISGTAPTPL